jgi:hypothetical protein
VADEWPVEHIGGSATDQPRRLGLYVLASNWCTRQPRWLAGSASTRGYITGRLGSRGEAGGQVRAILVMDRRVRQIGFDEFDPPSIDHRVIGRDGDHHCPAKVSDAEVHDDCAPQVSMRS